MSYRMMTIDGVYWLPETLHNFGHGADWEELEELTNKIKEKLEAKEWLDVKLEVEDDYGRMVIVLCGYRRATITEIQEHVNSEARSKKVSEDREKAEFERLKAKFGG